MMVAQIGNLHKTAQTEIKRIWEKISKEARKKMREINICVTGVAEEENESNRILKKLWFKKHFLNLEGKEERGP